MLTAQQLKERLKKKHEKTQSDFQRELLELYSFKSKIESIVSAMLLDNAKPEFKGITFYDDVFGEEYLKFKSGLKVLTLEVMADHICNWFYFNGYYSKFMTEDNKIHFLVKWENKNEIS